MAHLPHDGRPQRPDLLMRSPRGEPAPAGGPGARRNGPDVRQVR